MFTFDVQTIHMAGSLREALATQCH